MTEVFSAYEALDMEADETLAKTFLRRLGFSKEGKQIGALNGGWRMRDMLGKALYINPDILLLDEPSTFHEPSTNQKKKKKLKFTLNPANHLDLLAFVWLQSYLTNEEESQTVVVVPHDR